MTIRNYSELVKILFDETNGKTVDEVKAELAKPKSRMKLISRMWRRYDHAHSKARNFGYIGVGAISFAEHRLMEYQRRAKISDL